MACCCKTCSTEKSQTSCLGRCGLPKHRCIKKKDLPPGPVPSYFGWLYTAKDAPKHQLRCGWRPGHIFQPVLRQIEQQRCMASCCAPCPHRGCNKPCRPTCGRTVCMPICSPGPPCRPCPPRPPCRPCPPRPPCRPICPPRPCRPICAPGPCPGGPCPPGPCPPGPCPPCLPNPICSKTSCLRKGCSKPCCTPCVPNPCCLPPEPSPLIRIIRRNGQYTICTQPTDVNTSPSGPNPLKYVLNLDEKGVDPKSENTKYSIEAKYNDNQFDFTSSDTSFILDFTPPPRCPEKCLAPCYPRPCSVACLQCPK